MATAIYAIVNSITKDMYVGSAISVRRRWKGHKYALKRGTHHSPKLQNAVNKYGLDIFNCEIIQLVEDKSKLIEREQFWIDFFKPTYNGRPVAHSPFGTRHTEETKEKMSAAHKGRRFSAEHCANISAAKKGCVIKEEQRKLLSEIGKGKRLSDASKAKISMSLMGNKRAAGREYSLEERAKISERMKKTWEQRKQLSEGSNVN